MIKQLRLSIREAIELSTHRNLLRVTGVPGTKDRVVLLSHEHLPGHAFMVLDTFYVNTDCRLHFKLPPEETPRNRYFTVADGMLLNTIIAARESGLERIDPIALGRLCEANGIQKLFVRRARIMLEHLGPLPYAQFFEAERAVMRLKGTIGNQEATRGLEFLSHQTMGIFTGDLEPEQHPA